MRRYETRSTVMTSNRPLEDWGKLIGDVPNATAILDRFLHHADVLTFNGKSYRLRNENSTPTATPDTADPDPKPAIPPTGSSPPGRRKKGNSTTTRHLRKVTTLTKIKSLQPRLPNSARPWLHLNRPLTPAAACSQRFGS